MSLNLGERKKQWGDEVKSIDDVVDVFKNFLHNNIKKFPFAENQVSSETTFIIDMLDKMLEHKLLPVNSQPVANGVPSNDPIFGWGPSNGYIFQKAYIEFFIHKDALEKLIKFLD